MLLAIVYVGAWMTLTCLVALAAAAPPYSPCRFPDLPCALLHAASNWTREAALLGLVGLWILLLAIAPICLLSPGALVRLAVRLLAS